MKKNLDTVSSEYSKAIKGTKKGFVAATCKARFAHYSSEELDQLPADISENSFGCGNPVSFSDVLPGQVVLDLGCGAGLDLLLAAKKVGQHGQVIGVDINNDMLKKAKENIASSGLDNIEVRKGQLENLPIDSASIDWVISNCVINLSFDKEKAFSEIARVLKPGGQMLISDIVAENLPWWFKHSGVLTASCMGGGTISEESYLQRLKSAGIANCSVIARQHYDPSQLSSIVVEMLPKAVKNLTCCGQSIAGSIFTKIAKPISQNLWSAKISGKMPLDKQIH